MDDIICRRGDKCRFVVKIGNGTVPLDTRFDKARFQVRDSWALTVPALIAVDETSGIAFDYAGSSVTVEIGALATSGINVRAPKNVPAQLRLYNSQDPNDRISWVIGFMLLPSAVSDD